MTITENDIGTFFILRVNEPILSDETRKVLESLSPIGIHFGKDAFLHDTSYGEWVKRFAELREAILQATQRPQMIWALDHEGGRVHRLPEPITHLSYPLNWKERSHEVGLLVGTELRSLGINLLFGPCLDIFSNPQNAVIGPRAFGKSEREVETFALQYISAVQSTGVVACGKHFPGHGDTLQDSHFELPVLDLSVEQLLDRELKPFTSACNQGLQAVMLAHILFPQIHSSLPSSLASECTRKLLRESCGFSGVSITDDLDMKAIADHFPPKELAPKIAEAEVDLLIFNHHFDTAAKLAAELSSLIEGGRIDQEFLTARKKRLEFLFSSFHTEAPGCLDDSVLQEHAKLAGELPENESIAVDEYQGN